MRRPADLHVVGRLVLPARLATWSPQFAQAAELHGIDPLLLAAICDRETRGGTARGLDVQGPGGRGDGGHGHGLMQIDDRYHSAFIGKRLADGSPAWADPFENIAYAAALLLRLQVACRRAFCARPYAVQEAAAIAAYNCGLVRVARSLRKLARNAPAPHQLLAVDVATTGSDYSKDVLARRELYRANAQKAGVVL